VEGLPELMVHGMGICEVDGAATKETTLPEGLGSSSTHQQGSHARGITEDLVETEAHIVGMVFFQIQRTGGHERGGIQADIVIVVGVILPLAHRTPDLFARLGQTIVLDFPYGI